MPDNLQRMLSPRTVAVLGASDDPLKPGGRVIDYMKRHGFTGAIYPVSLNRPQVQGLAAFQSLSQVPEPPDLVVVALPQAQIVEAISMAATLGAAGVVIFASGYAELGDEDRASQAALAQLAQSLGVRLVGPNTQGMANFATSAIAHFGTIIDQLPPLRAPVGIVSQSGAGSQILYTRLHEVGVGVDYLVATGNEADVDVAAPAVCSSATAACSAGTRRSSKKPLPVALPGRRCTTSWRARSRNTVTPSKHASTPKIRCASFRPAACWRVSRLPSLPGVRVHAVYRQGNEVTSFYDPMLAKIIARADDRAAQAGAVEHPTSGGSNPISPSYRRRWTTRTFWPTTPTPIGTDSHGK